MQAALTWRRADTIDLQDHQSPSAQDHSRHPYRANPQSKHLSPHQADALRNAEEEAAEEQQNSPRLSWANGDGLQPEEDQFDGVLNRLMQGQTGDERHEPEGDRHGDVPSLGSSLGEETDMADIEGDDGLDDDDLMDKISSSPSIDDGGYPLSLSPSCSSRSTSTAPRPDSLHSRGDEAVYASSFISTSVRFALGSNPQDQTIRSNMNRHASPSRYARVSCSTEVSPSPGPDSPASQGYPERKSSLPKDRGLNLAPRSLSHAFNDEDDLASEEYDLPDFLLPLDDPILNDTFDNVHLLPRLPAPNQFAVRLPGHGAEVEDHEGNDSTAHESSFSDDARFTDSGWGADCLRETEDIDFEFVYALHTFTATVEGQANASKGDTMVLLDDSNSYWWLVRVVKDSSIGGSPAVNIRPASVRDR